jgi:hypothetical protein
VNTPDLIEAVARTMQVVAGIVADARGGDFKAGRALGWPLTIAMLQLTVNADKSSPRHRMTV